jgi:hypothetical protein
MSRNQHAVYNTRILDTIKRNKIISVSLLFDNSLSFVGFSYYRAVQSVHGFQAKINTKKSETLHNFATRDETEFRESVN